MDVLSVAIGCWIGIVMGLYWGERGRRIDAQKAARVYRPSNPTAKVQEQPTVEGVPMDVIVDDEQMERLIRDTIKETGCSRKDAEEDVWRMLSASSVMGLDH